jgi:hypothetical protein
MCADIESPHEFGLPEGDLQARPKPAARSTIKAEIVFSGNRLHQLKLVSDKEPAEAGKQLSERLKCLLPK